MKVLVAGDFYPSERVKKMIDKGEYDGVLGNIYSIVRSSDYALVNYESPVVLGCYKPIVKCGPHLASTKKGLEAIKKAGFDMVTLANNHICDFGAEGLNDTIKTCKEYGIDVVGVGNNLNDAHRVFYKKIQDKTLAVINCCEHEFSVADVNTPGANPINVIQQYYQIREAKKNANYVLVVTHGGHEHFQLPSPRMVETYRFFIDVGADVVINHHQHCFSGYEIYKGKPIFYGLGNLCFDNLSRCNTIWNEGYMVEIYFHESISYQILPYIQCRENAEIKMIKSKEKLADFNDAIDCLNQIIRDEKKLKEKHQKWMDGTQQMYRNAFELYKGRLMKALFNRKLLPSLFNRHNTSLLLNIIACEAHRDRLINLLKQNCHG